MRIVNAGLFSVKKKVVILRKKVGQDHVTISDMPRRAEPSALQEFVERVMREKGLIPSTVARRAREKGFDIDESYVGKIKNGTGGQVTIPKAQALAVGLDVDEDEFFDILRGVSRPERFRESKFWQLYEAYTRISDPLDRGLIETYVERIQASTEMLIHHAAESDRKRNRR